MAIGDLMGMMKQAKELQAKMEALQQEVAAMEITGASGGGLVKVTLSAKGELRSIAIDPSLLKAEEKEIVEDLIVAAHAEGRKKADAAMQEKMREVTAGLPLPPGMKLPF
jgi:DNA-binding YbaB/EbfC family protein